MVSRVASGAVVHHATEQPQNDEYDQHDAQNPTEPGSAVAIVAVIAPPPPSSRMITTMIIIVPI